MPTIAGADGCPGGWVYIRRDTDSGELGFGICATARTLLEHARNLAVLTIDIPIGLSDQEPRCCDLQARHLLGRRRGSSVFPAPVRAVLRARTWEDACAASERITGKRVSKQTFGIMPRIREVDVVLRGDLDLRQRVRETHPELCFYFWNNRRPMVHRKKIAAGRRERLALVKRFFGNAFTEIRRAVPMTLAADDDVLDAFAALWSADRVVAGTATVVPQQPPVDRFGLRMEMVA